MVTDDDAITRPAQRVEVFTGTGRRRAWLHEEKARIVAEIGSSGDSVCAVVAQRGTDILTTYASISRHPRCRVVFQSNDDRSSTGPMLARLNGVNKFRSFTRPSTCSRRCLHVPRRGGGASRTGRRRFLNVSVARQPFRLALDVYFDRSLCRRGFQLSDKALMAASSAFQSTTLGSKRSGPPRRICSCCGWAGSLMASRYSA
jgi:hypothetical protein